MFGRCSLRMSELAIGGMPIGVGSGIPTMTFLNSPCLVVISGYLIVTFNEFSLSIPGDVPTFCSSFFAIMASSFAGLRSGAFVMPTSSPTYELAFGTAVSVAESLVLAASTIVSSFSLFLWCCSLAPSTLMTPPKSSFGVMALMPLAGSTNLLADSSLFRVLLRNLCSSERRAPESILIVVFLALYRRLNCMGDYCDLFSLLSDSSTTCTRPRLFFRSMLTSGDIGI